MIIKVENFYGCMIYNQISTCKTYFKIVLKFTCFTHKKKLLVFYSKYKIQIYVFVNKDPIETSSREYITITIS